MDDGCRYQHDARYACHRLSVLRPRVFGQTLSVNSAESWIIADLLASARSASAVTEAYYKDYIQTSRW